MFDRNIPTFGRVLSINATSTRKAVAAYLLSEEERSLGNWSNDVTAVRDDDAIYSTTQFYKPTLATYDNNSSQT